MRVKRVECTTAILLRSPSCPSFLGISIISVGRIHGPDGGFICCCSPLSVFFFFFFLEPLKLLKVEGLREGRMTVNQDPALSPGKVEGNTFE